MNENGMAKKREKELKEIAEDKLRHKKTRRPLRVSFYYNDFYTSVTLWHSYFESLFSTLVGKTWHIYICTRGFPNYEETGHFPSFEQADEALEKLLKQGIGVKR